MAVFLRGYVSRKERGGRESEREREERGGIEHGAVIIYRSRYHRLLVNRPHQGVGEKRDRVQKHR